MATAWILKLPFRPATCRVGLAVMGHRRSDGLTVGWCRCNAAAQGEIQRPPGDVGRPSLAGDFARFCQCLFERYSLHSTALHFGNSAPCIILPGLIDGRVDFAVFGAQYPIDQIGDCVLGPIAGLFDDRNRPV